MSVTTCAALMKGHDRRWLRNSPKWWAVKVAPGAVNIRTDGLLVVGTLIEETID